MSDFQQSDGKIESNKEFFVVGIGASAGGLSALEELFEHLPVNSGAAFVVIQHLSPDFKSLMKELLQRRTEMAVYRVTEGMKLQPNSVYLIPPGKNLVVEANLLRLEERKKDKNNKPELNFPIDLFFQSLAKNYADNAIGVILSGSGSDGTRGLRAINEAGGVSLVQTPETAEFDGMPRSAIATGVANQILAPRELAQLIYQCIVLPPNFPETEFSKNSSIDSFSLKEVTDLLIESQDLDFSHYKTSTISRRINRRRLINNLENIPNYIKLLKASPDERQILCSDLLINVTHFFRNKPAWEKLENKILPLLIEQAKPNEELRFWVTACSTGEEAYSLAILVNEALIDSDKQLRVKIFATDIDRTALEKASLGIYPQFIANDINTRLLHKYFIAKDDGYQIMRKLREMMIFSPHDLTKDAGFTRMHLISCRNVLIYMQPALQHQVLGNLHFSLIVKGVLFLGEAESVSLFESEFKTLDSKWKIYQKQRSVRLPIPLKANPRTSVRSLLHFLDIANRNSLMPAIDAWVVDNLLATLAQMNSRDLNDRHFSINLSGASLNSESFLESLSQKLSDYHLPSKLFCFEITETVAISNLDRVSNFINSLKTLGCSFALDDFGKGMSSLTYLKNLPIDYLKIDGSFITELNKDKVSKIMVEAINHIAEGIGLKTVAEFVENQAILDTVRELRVNYAQGYYLGRPQKLADILGNLS
jgi:two-component system CheB/CheR fusion protein